MGTRAGSVRRVSAEPLSSTTASATLLRMLHTVFNDFGITFSNNANSRSSATTRNLASRHQHRHLHELSNFSGLDVLRVHRRARDYDNPEGGYPWTSVWYSLGILDAANPGWYTGASTSTTHVVHTLPAGWGGCGRPEHVRSDPPGRPHVCERSGGRGRDCIYAKRPASSSAIDHDVSIDNITVNCRSRRASGCSRSARWRCCAAASLLCSHGRYGGETACGRSPVLVFVVMDITVKPAYPRRLTVIRPAAFRPAKRCG